MFSGGKTLEQIRREEELSALIEKLEQIVPGQLKDTDVVHAASSLLTKVTEVTLDIVANGPDKVLYERALAAAEKVFGKAEVAQKLKGLLLTDPQKTDASNQRLRR